MSRSNPWSALNLPHLVEFTRADPDKPAVVFEGRRRSYGELRERMHRAGAGLAERGVGKGDRVAVLSRNRLEYLEIELAIAWAGGVMVPLNYRLTEEEVEHLLDASRAHVIFAESEFLDVATKLQARMPGLELVIALPEEEGGDERGEVLAYEALCAGEATQPCATILLEDPEEVIYTSGTTGHPKGVVWTHGTLLWNSIQQCMDYEIGPTDSNYVLNDLYYIGGRHDFTWPLIHQGGTVHIRRSGGFDAASVMSYLSENQITKALLFPVMLLDILELPDLDQYRTGSLRTIISGGEPVPVPTIERTLAAFPESAFLQVYGLTEGGATVTFLSDEDAERKMGSCGKASLHNEIRIRDDEDRDVPAETVGEVCVRGPSVTAGYWEDDELTREVLKGGWLHTGDLGKMDSEGFLYIIGRKKDMIISGGMNIYPSEIEEVLRRLPAVQEAAVIGVPHRKWGEAVCAVVQLAADESATEEEIINWCRERIASYKKPTVVKFVDEMPRTASGKTRKESLRERYVDAAQARA